MDRDQTNQALKAAGDRLDERVNEYKQTYITVGYACDVAVRSVRACLAEEGQVRRQAGICVSLVLEEGAQHAAVPADADERRGHVRRPEGLARELLQVHAEVSPALLVAAEEQRELTRAAVAGLQVHAGEGSRVGGAQLAVLALVVEHLDTQREEAREVLDEQHEEPHGIVRRQHELGVAAKHLDDGLAHVGVFQYAHVVAAQERATLVLRLEHSRVGVQRQHIDARGGADRSAELA